MITLKELEEKFTQIADETAQQKDWDNFNDVLFNAQYGQTRVNLLETIISQYTKHVWNTAVNTVIENIKINVIDEITHQVIESHDIDYQVNMLDEIYQIDKEALLNLKL